MARWSALVEGVGVGADPFFRAELNLVYGRDGPRFVEELLQVGNGELGYADVLRAAIPVFSWTVGTVTIRVAPLLFC